MERGTKIEIIGEAVVDLCRQREDQVRMVIDALLRDGEAAVPEEDAGALDALAGILSSGLEVARS